MLISGGGAALLVGAVALRVALTAEFGPVSLEFAFLTAAHFTALVIIPFTRTRVAYFAGIAAVLLAGILAMPRMGDSSGMHAVYVTGLLVVTILLEPFPNNLVISVGVVIVAVSGSLLVSVKSGVPTAQYAPGKIGLAVSLLTIAAFGSLMTRFREAVVDLTHANDRYRESVLRLARLSTQYQKHAADAESRAMEAERLRITRDIHDVVGYTLTNNMMLMEAAIDVMKENALALPTLLRTARMNAEDGLQQIRQSLYHLREESTQRPVGLSALKKLVDVFKQATGIDISCEFTNAPLVLDDEADSAVYHLVQESLVNSFRHGRATSILLLLSCEPGVICVTVLDNGHGTPDSTDGIGLSGMRERIESIGGGVEAKPCVTGFQVTARIPLKDEHGCT